MKKIYEVPVYMTITAYARVIADNEDEAAELAMDNVRFIEYCNETVGAEYYGDEIDGLTLSADGMKDICGDGIIELGVAVGYDDDEDDDVYDDEEEEEE